MTKAIDDSPTVALRDLIADMSSSGRKIVDLTAGEPDFSTPSSIVEEAVLSLRLGETKYTSSKGLPELREAILRFHGGGHLHYEAAVTASGKMAIFTAFASLLDIEDSIVVLGPTWPSYKGIARMLSAEVVELQLSLLDSFSELQHSLEKIRPKIVMICNPNNPTSSQVSTAQISNVARLLKEMGIYLVVDEIYAPLCGEFPDNSMVGQVGTTLDNVVVLGGFSKAFAMTGWRIGYIIADEDILRSCVSVIQNTTSCCPIFVQKAALKALTQELDFPHKMASDFRRRALLLQNELSRTSTGLAFSMPEGEFYAWIQLPLGVEDEELVGDLLRQENVAVVPGSVFGEEGRGHIRVSLAATDKQLIYAARALGRTTAQIQEKG